MAIGISYNGHKMSASSAAELQQLMAKHGSEMVGRTLPARRAVKQHGAPKLETPDPVDGPLVGIEGNDVSEPDGMSRPVGSKGGWRMECSRVEIEVKPSMEMKCNEVILTKLAYQVIFSEKGLAKGRTPEKRVWRKSFFVLADGGKPSKCAYGVRAFWDDEGTDKPTLAMLAFGTESDLGTWNGEKFTVNDTAIDESGNKTYPVKMVGVSACSHGIANGESGGRV